MTEKEEKNIEDKNFEEKTICPFCLIELKQTTDWQKFFLIISGFNDFELNELLLLTDKANEIVLKEVTRRTGIKQYETQQSPPQPQSQSQSQPQQPFSPPMIPGNMTNLQSFPPNAKRMIEDVILKKWKNKLCPFCQTQDWIVNEQIFQLSQWQQGGGIVIGPNMKVQPVVSIICKTCGYTTLSNAIINGVVKIAPRGPPPG